MPRGAASGHIFSARKLVRHGSNFGRVFFFCSEARRRIKITKRRENPGVCSVKKRGESVIGKEIGNDDHVWPGFAPGVSGLCRSLLR